jgi:hypothetical protein
MSTKRSLHPPRLASWLVDLFTPYDQAESIAGDLHEEFVMYISEHRPVEARRWYWRQCVKTIAHCAIEALRTSWWSIAIIIVVCQLCLTFGGGLPEQAWFGVLHLVRGGVTPYHANWYGYVFWLNTCLLAAHLLFCFLIGWAAALIAKGKELITTAALCIPVTSMFIALTLRTAGIGIVSPGREHSASFFLVNLVEPTVMFILSGWVVRDIRMGRRRAHC